ncbi:hypothetical protein F4679DRAFT_587633 [Xylaria curta]|nr:hypothetical protein F4679DRAFT_587633 [Xylaria curta]
MIQVGVSFVPPRVRRCDARYSRPYRRARNANSAHPGPRQLSSFRGNITFPSRIDRVTIIHNKTKRVRASCRSTGHDKHERLCTKYPYSPSSVTRPSAFARPHRGPEPNRPQDADALPYAWVNRGLRFLWNRCIAHRLNIKLGSRVAAAAAWKPRLWRCQTRLLLRVPDDWSDLRAATLDGIGWGTAGLALWGTDAMELEECPTRPVAAAAGGGRTPILVYGNGDHGVSGYHPIAVMSKTSAALAKRFGVADSEMFREHKDLLMKLPKPSSLCHALDCITDPESAAVCFGAGATDTVGAARLF